MMSIVRRGIGLALIATCLKLCADISNVSRMKDISEVARSLVSDTVTTSSNSTSKNVDDWFDGKEWASNPVTNSCFYVENICHSAHTWFYDDDSYQHDEARQPPFSLRVKHHSENEGKWESGYPLTVDVLRRQEVDSEHALQCQYSLIPNHLVLQSYYSMLGEFYVRALMGFADIFNEQEQLGLKDDFMIQTQVYLHMENINSGLLDSHHLFSNVFLSNPLLPVKTLFDSTGCRCLKRLVLCGYQEKNEENKTFLDRTGRVGVTDYPTFYHHLPVHKEYNKIRQQLREGVVQANPIIQQEIKDYRKTLLGKMGIARQPLEEWKIVGLTQRRLRRRWLNMDDCLRKCNEHFNKHKIACVELNVESQYSNVVTQVAMHAVLDMIIGVHGAQLVESMWMKEGSFILELLPWIHPWTKWGRWARVTTQPTPLGIIWMDTDLNHIGYPLPRESVLECFNETTQEYETTKECFDRTPFDFAYVNVQVDPDIVIQAIENFLLPDPSSLTKCEDWEKQADADFVLYNVNCADSDSNETRPHRFFQELNETVYV